MATKKKTQIEKLIKRLASGKNLTVSEAKNRMGIQRLSARVHELRTVFNLPVFTNKVKVGTKTVTAYRLSDKATKKALSFIS